MKNTGLVGQGGEKAPNLVVDLVFAGDRLGDFIA